MLSLTTAQRDLLLLLLTTDRAIGAAALGARLHLTARQAQYGLREIRPWLERRHVQLAHTPGVGVQLICPPEQRQRLLAELAAQPRFQLILAPEQRQQLLALCLLAETNPLTLGQLQHDLAVARATVLKDLDTVEPWLARYGLSIARRQHRGCWVAGPELARRQALAALLWGDAPFEHALTSVQHAGGIVFALARDAGLLPIVARVGALVQAWALAPAQAAIGQAEAALGARFTDEAVLALALALALQNQRVRAGMLVEWTPADLAWLQAQPAWPAGLHVAAELWPSLAAAEREAETAALALQLLSGARDEPWRVSRAADPAGHALADALLRQIAQAYAVPELTSDQLLRDGLDALIVPAWARQRFGLWAPPKLASDTHTERYAAEQAVAARLTATVAELTGHGLPADALDDLILLLRAAVVRARPERSRRVLVVCPSGMATTQLLVARLRARFPRLGTFEVLPMRELTAARLAGADLIITTVPLALANLPPVDVIHVHPMLRPEDVAALTHWMV